MNQENKEGYNTIMEDEEQHYASTFLQSLIPRFRPAPWKGRS